MFSPALENITKKSKYLQQPEGGERQLYFIVNVDVKRQVVVLDS